ncbi:apof [Pungitius sinensis]
MMSSKLKWLIVIQLLLNEEALCRVPPPLGHGSTPLPAADINEASDTTAERDHLPLLGLKLQRTIPSEENPKSAPKEGGVQSAKNIISVLRAKLPEQIQDHLHINVSCRELLAASTLYDPSSSLFPQELLALSLVPVLVVAGCQQEAQTLVLKLHDLLGVADAEDLLMEVGALIERRVSKAASTPAGRKQAGRHMEAVMFNIQQLTALGEGHSKHEGRCEGWTRVSGTALTGTAAEGARGDLEEALGACERLGALCAGVTSSGPLQPGEYSGVLTNGSRVLPSEFPASECWIRRCGAEEGASGRRVSRSTRGSCINKSEERVYNVVEWIPAVSTLYNLGTAVYYASVNCSETAKERALLSAVDLGTDALMVATGGTAGVAGYALGAGVKTGVKAGVRYLLNSMKQEDDVLVNQVSWEDGVFAVQ